MAKPKSPTFVPEKEMTKEQFIKQKEAEAQRKAREKAEKEWETKQEDIQSKVKYDREVGPVLEKIAELTSQLVTAKNELKDIKAKFGKTRKKSSGGVSRSGITVEKVKGIIAGAGNNPLNQGQIVKALGTTTQTWIKWYSANGLVNGIKTTKDGRSNCYTI